MKSFKGDMMTLIGKVDVLCVTTNGFVKRNGSCVMGKGIAKQIASRYPNIPFTLGRKIKEIGNIPAILATISGTIICSFPVKPVQEKVYSVNTHVVKHMRSKFKSGDIVPGWACVASPEIIKDSARRLVQIANSVTWKSIALPKMGCGAGELKWSDIEPIVDEIFDDRFIICDWK